MTTDLAALLANAAGPRRPPVSMTTVRVDSTSPLRLDDAGSPLDRAVEDLYGARAGDLAIMLRAGGLAVLIGKKGT